MTRLYAEYGSDTVDAVSERADRAVRASCCGERLRELPDGTWRSRQYVDMPDGLHRVVLAMTKDGDTLTFDFTGTDPQSALGINYSYWATWGGDVRAASFRCSPGTSPGTKA